MKKIKFIILFSVILLLSIGILIYNGILWPNYFFTKDYDIKGIDISHHQNNIDWNKVSKENYSFVYMKATEGEDYVDSLFETNWTQTSDNNLYKGAYHYFKITSTGKDQANNFIKTVPKEKNCLPPVVDIEENGLSVENFNKELSDYISILEEHYNQKVIIYTVYSLYDEYIKGNYKNNQIWIRDIVKNPSIDEEWLIWQYSNRGHVDGIDTYVDLNVFNGTKNDFMSLLSK
jgi:lysozyme